MVRALQKIRAHMASSLTISTLIQHQSLQSWLHPLPKCCYRVQCEGLSYYIAVSHILKCLLRRKLILSLYKRLKNGEVFQYKGDRSREPLVDYAERMALPPLQQIVDTHTMKVIIQSTNFFLYVGENKGSLWVRLVQLMKKKVQI